MPQSVDELRIFRSNTRSVDRPVKAAEDLLECVVVAFAVTTGKIGVTPRPGLEQRRILDKNLIATIAMTGPEFVGTLLVPCDGRSRSVNFNAEPVLAPSRNLAGHNAAARPSAHAENHGPKVFRGHGGFNVILRAK